MREVVKNAIEFAKRGLRVFPIQGRAKFPPLVRFTTEASDDPEQIARWGEQYHSCNFGALCNGHTVLDLDSRKGTELDALLVLLDKQYGADIRRTLRVATPTGGLHIYFKGESRNTTGLIHPHIDTRGHNGYVLIPGSEVDGGLAYSLIQDAPILSCPPSLQTDLAPKAGKEHEPDAHIVTDLPASVAAATDFLLNMAPIAVEGEHGDATTYAVACRVKDFGVSEGLAFQLIWALYNPKCLPPWSPEELQIKIENAYRYGSRVVGAESPSLLDEIPLDFRQPISRELNRLADLVDTQIPPRRWILGNRLLRGHITVCIAPGGVGKSTFMMEDCYSIACNIPLLGPKVFESGPVWVYNTEDPLDELQRRMAAIRQKFGYAKGTENLFFSSGRKQPLILAEMTQRSGCARRRLDTIKEIKSIIRGEGIIVWAVDPFVRTHLLDENNNAHIDFLASVYAEIAEETNCAIYLAHHTRKATRGVDSSGQADSARGASALINAARIAFTLSGLSKRECSEFNIPAETAWQFLRVDDAKMNLAARSSQISYFQRESIQLANGDQVGILTPKDLDAISMLKDKVDEEILEDEIIGLLPVIISESISVTNLSSRLTALDKFPRKIDAEAYILGLPWPLTIDNWRFELKSKGRGVTIHKRQV